MYFNKCKNLDELKAAYRKAAMENHPDRGGDTATMQRINAEYESTFNFLKSVQNRAAAVDSTVKSTAETPEEFMEIISRLIILDGINVELCGRWIWISGNTFKHKAALKEAGCKWASKKKMWYWHFEEDSVVSRRRVSMDKIREKYGSQSFGFTTPSALGA